VPTGTVSFSTNRRSGLERRQVVLVGGVSSVVPVDLHIRGCPPGPAELLRGLLALLDVSSGTAQPAAASAS